MIVAIVCCFLGLGIGAAEENAEEVTVEFAQEMGENELAGGYINSMMPARRLLRAVRPSGLNLKGANRKLYTALRTRISQVASGEESSTAFEIPAREIFEQWAFTAEELGIDALGMYEEEEDEFCFYTKVNKPFKAKVAELVGEIDFTQVMACLMADCAYELYWFNKSYTVPTNDFDKQISEDYTKAEIAGNYKVTLLVSLDYAVRSLAEDGRVSYSRNAVDTGYGESVRMAAENAAEILAKYSGKSDEEKLYGYRNAICSLADYNYEVNKDTPYGDPWQIVWVFDGKPNTRVVCEGYAKAFQYLCELGTESAEAISVQGAIPAGLHMWNIVKIGKRNYLADLTNYDVGFDLFMKGYADGDIESGYWVSGVHYVYDLELTERTEDELRLSRWDYGSGGGELRLPSGLTEIENYAFEGGKFEAVIVPDECGYIGHGAFKDCDELVYVRVPSGCVVEEDAFEGCGRLK